MLECGAHLFCLLSLLLCNRAGADEISGYGHESKRLRSRMVYYRRSQNSIDDYLEKSRMKRLSLVLIPFALLLLAACQTDKSASTPNANNSSPAAQSTPDQFAAVRTSYEKNCKLCHGANGEGGPVKLDDGTKLKVPSLREGHALKHPDPDFVKQITKGGDGMPAFGEKLKPEEINDMIRFIRQEFQGGKTPPTK